jgi:hypothetical protein
MVGFEPVPVDNVLISVPSTLTTTPTTVRYFTYKIVNFDFFQEIFLNIWEQILNFFEIILKTLAILKLHVRSSKCDPGFCRKCGFLILTLKYFDTFLEKFPY